MYHSFESRFPTPSISRRVGKNQFCWILFTRIQKLADASKQGFSKCCQAGIGIKRRSAKKTIGIVTIIIVIEKIAVIKTPRKLANIINTSCEPGAKNRVKTGAYFCLFQHLDQ